MTSSARARIWFMSSDYSATALSGTLRRSRTNSRTASSNARPRFAVAILRAASADRVARSVVIALGL
jgi:hypothetical protein